MIVYLCSLYANSLKPVVDIDYSVDKISLSLLVYYTQWRVQGGLPGRGPPWLDAKIFFSLVPILNRYARPGLSRLTMLNSKFHRISRFEQYNFGQFLSKVNSFLSKYSSITELAANCWPSEQSQKRSSSNTRRILQACGLLAGFCIQVFKNFQWVTRQLPWREESVTA
jgi:hypothetical protein